jgi:hypothetical protein
MERYSRTLLLGEHLPAAVRRSGGKPISLGISGGICYNLRYQRAAPIGEGLRGRNIFILKKREESVEKTLTRGREQSLWWWQMVRGYLSGLSLLAQRPMSLR